MVYSFDGGGGYSASRGGSRGGGTGGAFGQSSAAQRKAASRKAAQRRSRGSTKKKTATPKKPSRRTPTRTPYKPPPKRNYSPRRSTQSSYSGSSGGSSSRSSSGGSTSARTAARTAAASDPKPVEPVTPPPPKFSDWLGDDSVYNAMAGSGGTINTNLDSTLTDLKEQERQYSQDIESALRNLGWDPAGNDGKGAWNAQDDLGAYGQSFKNARNDFSARGLMDSSFYADAVQDLDRNFDRQRNDYGEALERQKTNYANDRSEANSKAEAARRQARAEARSRYNARYSEV